MLAPLWPLLLDWLLLEELLELDELDELLEGKDGIGLELLLGAPAEGMLGREELELELEDGDGRDGELWELELDEEGIDGMLLDELELVDSQALSAIPRAVTSNNRENLPGPVCKTEDMTGRIVDPTVFREHELIAVIGSN